MPDSRFACGAQTVPRQCRQIELNHEHYIGNKNGKSIWSYPRELEILQFMIAGKTNKTIACEMHIREKTVEFHLDNIYTKIGERTRLMPEEGLFCQKMDS